MSRRLRVGVVVGCLAVTPTVGFAQSLTGKHFGVSVGPTFPVGALGDTKETGINLQGHIAYRTSSGRLGVRGDVGLWTTPGKTITPVLGGPESTYSGITWVTATGNVVVGLRSDSTRAVQPYAIAGVGGYVGNRGIGVKPGFNLGGGARLRLGRLHLFSEMRLHQVYTERVASRMVPISVGVLFQRRAAGSAAGGP